MRVQRLPVDSMATCVSELSLRCVTSSSRPWVVFWKVNSSRILPSEVFTQAVHRVLWMSIPTLFMGVCFPVAGLQRHAPIRASSTGAQFDWSLSRSPFTTRVVRRLSGDTGLAGHTFIVREISYKNSSRRREFSCRHQQTPYLDYSELRHAVGPFLMRCEP